MSTVASDHPPFQPTQEVRFAVVLYGGVSLAIYINGIVQELLHLVRATAPEVPSSEVDPDQTRAWFGANELSSTEAVYRELGQMLSSTGFDPHVGDGPIKTRFVVDILSGSSAGGINAVFLGKALANEQELEGIRDLWSEQADIAKLMNDPGSLENGDGLELQDPPLSLLNSRRLYCKVLVALARMEGENPPAEVDSKLVDELDCWITATDIRGLVLPIQLYDEQVLEPRYKNVFHFLYRGSHADGFDDDPRSAASIKNDFRHDENPFLAFAARCSSSFPFAFDPEIFSDTRDILRNDHFRRLYPAAEVWDTFVDGYRRFYADYSRAHPSPAFPDRSFGDGGYLDNKPFTWATDTLTRRRADVPVDRRLIYLEPSPETFSLIQDPARPDPIENTLDALTKLPRAETIREDLEQLRRRNRQVARIREVTEVTQHLDVFPDQVWRRLDDETWLATSLRQLISDRGLQWAAYHKLQVALVLDDLAQTVTRALDLDDRSNAYTAIRCVVEAWFEAAYESETKEEGTTQSRFLREHDLRYRLRRLNFVDSRIKRLLTRDDEELRADLARFGAPDESGWEDDCRATLRALKRDLNGLLVGLRRAGRAARDVSAADLFLPLQGLGLMANDITEAVLRDARTPEARHANAQRLIGDHGLQGRLTQVADNIADSLEDPIGQTRAAVAALLADREEDGNGAKVARRAVFHYHDAYENYDAVVLPLTYGATEEAGEAAIIRFSPIDAKELIDEETDERRKLGGVVLNHFGGFFSRDWRVNDMMWGRLDAAERLITTLIPPGHEQKGAALLERAQLAIIADEQERVFGKDDTRTPAELRTYLKETFDARNFRLDPDAMLDIARRSLGVTARVLAPISKGVGGALAKLAPPILAVFQTSTVRPPFVVLWAMVLAAGAAIGTGDRFDVEPAARFGWTLLPYVAVLLGGLYVLRGVVRKAIRPKFAALPIATPPPAPPAPPGGGGPPGPGFPTLQEHASYMATVRKPYVAGLIVLVVLILLLIFPLAYLNEGVEHAVSWLPGWD